MACITKQKLPHLFQFQCPLNKKLRKQEGAGFLSMSHKHNKFMACNVWGKSLTLKEQAIFLPISVSHN